MKRKLQTILICVATIMCLQTVNAQVKPSLKFSKKASMALIERVLPGYSGNFVVRQIPDDSGKDVFEVYSENGKIVLSGNNGVSVASALNWYLKNHCNFELTWNGPGCGMPSSFPRDIDHVRKVSQHRYRYYLNYCTFSYTMAWWDWERWQKEIDWMAMNGINMPLAITGEEAIWQRVYKKMGLTDSELSEFFTGPAFFGWFYMNNMDEWGGPLPQSWIDSHEKLQKKILERESELGMMPVLPAFTGHIPKAYAKKNPEAQVDSVEWHGQEGHNVYMLNPNDSRFAQIGKAFLEEQKKAYGTSHYYSSDIFNELMPPSDDPVYLAKTSAAVYETMKSADKDAVWVMQGWLFVSAAGKKFWTKERMKPFLDSVPDDKMVILELYSENRPRWQDTEAYYGKPWIWNMLHNFGGNIGLYGKAPFIAFEPARVMKDARRGNLSGIGLTMEGAEQNPMIYQLMLEHVWNDNPINLNEWTQGYILRRYGQRDENASKAWEILLKTVYRNNRKDQGAPESAITGRPTFNENAAWTWTDLVYYENRDFAPAWEYMIKASDTLGESNGFRYDLVDVTRQAMANYATALHRQISYTWNAGDLESYRILTERFLDLISDMDRLMKTRSEFLFGRWIADASAWGTTDEEQRLYEFNARDLVSIWGRKDVADISDYSCRQWSGLLDSYYKGRWEEFFRQTTECLEKGEKWDEKKFYDYIREWGWEWVNRTDETFATEPEGDVVEISREIYDKWWKLISRSEVFKQKKNELQ